MCDPKNNPVQLHSQGLIDHNINCLKMKIEAIFKLRDENNKGKSVSEAGGDAEGAVGGTAASVGAAGGAASFSNDGAGAMANLNLSGHSGHG